MRETFVLRVWLPDRPGALGQVASRIGAVRGDVVGIEILERGPAQVIDEIVVALPEAGLLDLLLSEIAQVDGVAVEDVHRIDDEPTDHGHLALVAATRLVAEPPGRRLAALCQELLALTEGDWVVAVDVGRGEPLVALGAAPDVAWVAAFLAGSQHLDPGEAGQAPGDIAWAALGGHGVGVAVERAERVFRARERLLVAELGRMADALGL